ncbi:hypothetical protein SprV_0200932000 [Sparganum proliferum]
MPLSTCETLIERSEIPQSVGAFTKGKSRNCMTHMSQTEQILAEINSESVIVFPQKDINISLLITQRTSRIQPPDGILIPLRPTGVD